MPPHVGFVPGTPAETVSVLPQLSITGGGVGAVAFETHATVDEPPAGMFTTGRLMVYVYTQSIGFPSQPVYVNVHVFVPAQSGLVDGTPAEGVTILPQASVTGGGVGAVAFATQATVDAPGGGNVNVDGNTVYVYTQLYGVPLHAEYVNVHVFVPPLQGGSTDGTPADGVIGRLQLSTTVGGVGAVAFDAHATVEFPPVGSVTVGAEIV